MKFSIKDFFSKCNQIRSFLPIWSHLPKKSLMENFIFCVVLIADILQILKFWKQKLRVLLEQFSWNFWMMYFFSPKYFLTQQSGCLILRSRQRPAWKIPTGSSWRPEIVSKVCSTMRTLSNSFQRNRYFVGKNC